MTTTNNTCLNGGVDGIPNTLSLEKKKVVEEDLQTEAETMSISSVRTHRSTSTSSTSTSSISSKNNTTPNVGAEQLATLFDDFMKFGSVGLHIVDNQGIILWANQAELDLLGYTEEEYFGLSVTDIYADQDELADIMSILLAGKKLIRRVAAIKCKDGHIEYVEINSSMRACNGELTTTRCFSVCVTDRVLRQQAELEALKRQQEADITREETHKKTRFLRQLCHELRNPLSGVAGNLELLLSGLENAAACGNNILEMAQKEEEQEATTITTSPTTSRAELLSCVANMVHQINAALECAHSAQMATEHQTLVINDTLNLSKLDSTQQTNNSNNDKKNDFHFNPQPVDFQQVLDSAVSILGVKAKQNLVSLHVPQLDVNNLARFVKTDLVWAKQVVSLLSLKQVFVV